VSDFIHEIELPFTPNTGRRCVPACTDMILKHLLPEQQFTFSQVEEMSGFREGYSTWAAQHLLSLNRLGIDVGWIQDENLQDFASNPDAFMRGQFPDEDSFVAFTSTNDIVQEAKRIDTYLKLELPFEQRRARQEDITARMLGGWVVRLEVNGKSLANRDGYAAHAVLVSGFNDEEVRLENPDGLYGSKPKQVMSWDKLHEAWTEPALQYYRKAVK
jgi:hypothetical protein